MWLTGKILISCTMDTGKKNKQKRLWITYEFPKYRSICHTFSNMPYIFSNIECLRRQCHTLKLPVFSLLFYNSISHLILLNFWVHCDTVPWLTPHFCICYYHWWITVPAPSPFRQVLLKQVQMQLSWRAGSSNVKIIFKNNHSKWKQFDKFPVICRYVPCSYLSITVQVTNH